MLGFFILMGTVVNNSTLIVHQALNHMREEGMEAQASIREATRNRIRPIFMTIGSNVFGMLPLVLFARRRFGTLSRVWEPWCSVD